ncbi:class III poly(R)-hydroxyalkanoic acid synthase subunit PhaC [Ammoniphilus sp. CFH 90114]|uniref:class III poly(R)-hydroxyalkanoic acid synthase subunit PhaC n=1 Tax=Ammoniphilus sp. CFH 90114 TaxID=2493665 RepID=UPI00100DC50E|nr:class III poly(R)-hydroxyalkanoic acid synthase subunit PhaC [Ammoniphilus sp. CFH 90114]RXT06252.1 class III poly(R)-hydroxyalkanoic acid synthase subunit PhaC [Ammoniphilus sp. CFH 90114]
MAVGPSLDMGKWEEQWKSLKRISEMQLKEGKPQVGLTPKEVVWKKNKAKLYRYAPYQQKKYSVPLLLIYALINKPYIMDLAPGNSLIEYLVGQGYDVFLLDWGEFGYEDKDLGFEEIVYDYVAKAVRKVQKISKSDEISLLGYCMGGTITSMYAALHSSTPICNIIFMATPIDFSDAGLFTKWLDESHFPIDKLVDTLGIIPPDLIDLGNKMLKPITNFYGPTISLLDKAHDEKFVSRWRLMNTWVSDGTPFPGEAYRQWIKEFYQKNKLVKGELHLRGRAVDLSQIKSNILNVIAKQDHIALPCQSHPIDHIVGSEDVTTVVVNAGHISLVFGRSATRDTYPTIHHWLDTRSR